MEPQFGYGEPEYVVKGVWGFGYDAEAVVIFAVSGEGTRAPTNRKIVIYDGGGAKIVFTNKGASEFLFAISELQVEWNDSL